MCPCLRCVRVCVCICVSAMFVLVLVLTCMCLFCLTARMLSSKTIHTCHFTYLTCYCTKQINPLSVRWPSASSVESSTGMVDVFAALRQAKHISEVQEPYITWSKYFSSFFLTLFPLCLSSLLCVCLFDLFCFILFFFICIDHFTE